MYASQYINDSCTESNIDCLYRKTMQLLSFYYHFLHYGVMTIYTKHTFNLPEQNCFWSVCMIE